MYRPGESNVPTAKLPDTLKMLSEELRRNDPQLQAILAALEDEKALQSIAQLARYIHDHYEQVIVLGVGGASLGGQTLCALGYHHNVRFVDTIDPAYFVHLLATLPLEKTAFIVISKSGETLETLSQFLLVLARYQAMGLAPKEHFYCISDSKESTLTHIANQYAMMVLPHPLDIGGRYSCFTYVGLLPAAIAGIDIHEVVKGACSVVTQTFTDHKPGLVHVGAAMALTMMEQGISNFVLMPYAHRLAPYNDWYAQLWAESMGKNGMGTTPVKAMGSVDQHSQLQLYIDGPKDKFFTFITEEAHAALPFGDMAATYIPFLQDKSLADVVRAESAATIATLMDSQCFVREMVLPQLSPASLGALMMHATLETILCARHLGIDPFTQPAVEAGKMRAKRLLGWGN